MDDAEKRAKAACEAIDALPCGEYGEDFLCDVWMTEGPQRLIAAAIREAVDAAVERSAKIAEAASPFIGSEWAEQLGKSIREGK